MKTVEMMSVWVLVLCCAAGFGFNRVHADEYNIGFSQSRSDDDGALRLATVKARFTPRDGGEFGLYRAGSDTGLYHQWATFVLNIEAEADNGESLPLNYAGRGVWTAVGWRQGEITVRYRMLLQHDRFPNEPGDDELAAGHSYGVFWTTRALLLEGRFSKEITVMFDLPAEWRVTTPWPSPENDWTFTPKNTDDLLDAAVLAGHHDETRIAIGDGEARLALGPPLAHTKALFVPLLESYLGQYSGLFGASPIDTILLVALDASFLGGGVMGRTISLSIPVEADLSAAIPIAAYIISHESFHLWNSQWQGDEQGKRELEWLSEGAADYYALLTGLRLGHIDVSVFLGQMSERYSKYLNALKSGQTLVSAADSKLASAASYDLIYSGGTLATLLIDLGIRQAHNSARSADDLMQRLHQGATRSEAESLDLDALGRILASEFQFDFGPVAKASVRGHEPLPLAKLLDSVGLEVSIAGDDTITATLGRVATVNDDQADAWLNWVTAN